MPSEEHAKRGPSPGALPKDESSGFLLSIILAAHTAAHAIGSISDEEKRAAKKAGEQGDLDSKLDSLLQGGQVSNVSSHSGSATPGPAGDKTGSNSLNLLTSNVHFEPIHELPLLTMGNGNLQLLHFDKKKHRKTPSDDMPKVAVNGGVVPSAADTTSARLSVSGGLAKVVRRKSVSNGAGEERASHDDDTLATDMEDDTSASTSETNPELEQILDSATVQEASKKRNREFHHVFRKIPLSDRLIDEFSCALSKDILVQGKMYLLNRFICFNSNILGWVTSIMIPLQEVIQIEKKSTAVLFPNGMIIRTLHQKYVFATFISRDSTFNLITKVWHNALLETSGDDPRRKRASNPGNRTRASVDDDTHSDAASDSSDDGLVLEPAESANTSLDERPDGPSRRPSKSTKSKNPVLAEEETDDLLAASDSDVSVKDRLSTPPKSDTFNGFPNPGPLSHAPTKHDYTKDAGDTEVIDTTFKAPLGVVYELLFGSDNSSYVKILQNLKNFDILTSSIRGISNSNKERNYTYIKPLGGSIGPKQTKCHITDTVQFCDFSKYVEVEQVTQTPDVPLGSSFKVRTRLFLTWAPENSTRMYVVTSVEWSAKSWIKGAIEKGSIDGQKEFMNSFVDTLTEIINAGGSGGGSKKKRRKTKSAPQQQAAPAPEPAKPLTLAEQLSSVLGAIGSATPIQIPMVSDVLNGLVIVMVFSLLYSLFLMRMAGGRTNDVQIASSSDAFTKLVKVNGHNYFILPSSDTYLADGRNRQVSEARLWDWINERSQGRLSVDLPLENSDHERFVGQEFEEVVRIAKKRVDQLYNRLDVGEGLK